MKVLILRGIPGCGKSTLACHIDVLNERPQTDPRYYVRMFSADYFFTIAGKYLFDPTRLGEAHEWCFKRYVESLREHVHLKGSEPRDGLLIVDNTNIKAWEIATYLAAAKAIDATADVLIYSMFADPYDAVRRQRHGVPERRVWQMFDAFMNETLPPHWPNMHSEKEMDHLEDWLGWPPGRINYLRDST